jgi:hypothetical protein
VDIVDAKIIATIIPGDFSTKIQGNVRNITPEAGH